MISVVIPMYNEQAGLADFFAALVPVVKTVSKGKYEIICVDDGSTDNTYEVLKKLSKQYSAIRIVALARNFGKEIAISAGIHEARGQAIIMLDGDGQHPVELIPEFINKWEAGAKVVVGIRRSNKNEGLVKRYGSKLFYGFFSRLTGIKLTAGATDFRLIDRQVQQQFVRLTERNRITRGLIDWLGYKQAHIAFDANPRQHGQPTYSVRKLVSLAINSMISLSLSPLYVTAYIGAVVLPVSALLGIGMIINALFGDPLGVHATGGAYVMVLVLFLIGILLVSQGIIGLYLSHIHTETQNRPLYIIDAERSQGLDVA